MSTWHLDLRTRPRKGPFPPHQNPFPFGCRCGQHFMYAHKLLEHALEHTTEETQCVTTRSAAGASATSRSA